jgi:GNAT superfamily N-acetyltransferase
MQVRPIRHEELPDLIRLYSFLNPDDPKLEVDMDLTQKWDEIFENDNLHYFVAEVDSRLVASCMLAVIPNLTRGSRPFGVMQNVVCDPEFRGRGIASALLEYANEFAWAENCYQILLQTGRPETHGFYRGVGYRDDIKTAFVIKPEAVANSI